MNACACRESLRDAQLAIGFSNQKVTATYAPVMKESLFAIRSDELQAVKLLAVAHRDDQRSVMHPQVVRLDAFVK